LRIGVFVCDCGSNIAGAVDTAAVRQYAETLPGVVAAIRNKYTCADPGQQEIQRAIYEHKLNRVVVASCSPASYEVIFRQCIEGAGLNPYLLEMANIREHCSWVHPGDREGATAKAMDLVASAVAKARLLEPQEEMEVPVTKRALVIGGGVAGIEAALEQTCAPGTPEERRALARRIYDIGYKALFEALRDAPQILFVISAGNSDANVDFDEFMPSSFKLPNVMVSGAVDQAGDETSFTSFGNSDVYSNGFEVDSYVPGGARLKMSGTSMSAPNLTNLAAKLWAVHPDLSVAQVKQLIIDGADDKQAGERTIRLMNPARTMELAAKRAAN